MTIQNTDGFVVKKNMADFDDLLLKTVKLWEDNSDIKQPIFEKDMHTNT